MPLVPTIRSIASEARPDARLDSWKEIARYLNRDPRTVQLWEKKEGLPVRRLTHQARSSVFAYPHELDAWLNKRTSLTEQNAPEVFPVEAAAGEINAKKAKPRQEGRLFYLPFASPVLRFAVLAAGFVLIAASAAGGFYAWRLHALAMRPVLSVLPFDNLTAADSGFVRKLTSSLASNIEHASGMRVVAVQAGQAKPASALSLQGTVAEVNGEATLTLELMDDRAQKHLWGRTWIHSVDSMQSATPEIAGAIADAIRQNGLAAKGGTAAGTAFSASDAGVDPRVHKAYLEGRFYWNQRGLDGLQKSIASFQRALAIDPRYAPAYSGMAESYVLMTDFGVMTNDEAFRHAKDAAHSALDIEPDSAEAYNALAMATYRQDWDFAKAEQYFRKAIQLRPDYAVAHQWYGEFLGDMRRFDQSIAELRRAKDLNPLSPMVSADLADGYMHAGRYGEAIAELKRVGELYPDISLPRAYLVETYLASGNIAAAESEAKILFDRTGNRQPLLWVAMHRSARAGNYGEARRLMQELTAGSRTPPSAYTMASMLFTVGDSDAAYIALERAYHEHSWWLVTMLVDPAFVRIHGEQRFLAMTHRVGLPVTAPGAFKAAVTEQNDKSIPLSAIASLSTPASQIK